MPLSPSNPNPQQEPQPPEPSVEGEQQVRHGNLPGEFNEETAWQDYAVQAIQGLYPHLRRGIDFEYGRPADDPQGEQKLLFQDEKFAPIDMGKVEETARKLVGRNPYADYKPGPPLHGGSVKDPGETKAPSAEQPPSEEAPYTEEEPPPEEESLP